MRSATLLALFLSGAAIWPAMAQQADNALTVVLPEAINKLESCNSSSNPVGRVVKPNVTETLTELDPATGKVVPRLATEWEQVGDGTWRFKLRDGVKFHDGSPFTAAAVASSIARTMNPALECLNARFLTGFEVTSNIPDDHTIEITTKPAQPILPLVLSSLPIVSADAPIDQADPKPNGTGPYVVESWPSPQEVTLKRFDGYWGDKPEVETAKFVYRADSAVQAAMVESGEADLAPYIAVQDATNPETDHSYPNTETPHVMIPIDVPPLDDVRVRKALNLALDRQAFIGSLVSKDAVVATQMVLPFIDGYNPDLKPWPYDPEQAKQLLAAAKADGAPVDVEITLYANMGLLPNITDMMGAMAGMWRAVGFNIKEQTIERAQFQSLVKNPHPADLPPSLFINSHDNARGDASFTLLFKYTSTGRQSETHNPDLDKLISEGAAATGEERTKLFREAFRIINQDIVADVPLFHMVGFARVSNRIDYTPTTLTNNEVKLEDIKFKK